ncbi:hypothetical protein [Paenibacillus periandrae]|uniref:hypothetical protein n=1 Tax=Paenibacillus periandrae TaxID=1761741 RepID=UPI001F09D59E|nr:hypothetical protein [Paenibacillus periandrae]
MENKKIYQPNFMVLRQKNNKGKIYKVTICKNTLNVLDEEVISGIPEGWSVQDFYDLFDEGKRLFEHIDNATTGNFEEHST